MRIQFKISEQKKKEIDQLMARTDSETRRELLISALKVLKWVIDEKEAGRAVVSTNEETGSVKELCLL